MSLLEVNALGISFGGLKAVDQFHISIEKKRIIWFDWPQRSRKNHSV